MLLFQILYWATIVVLIISPVWFIREARDYLEQKTQRDHYRSMEGSLAYYLKVKHERQMSDHKSSAMFSLACLMSSLVIVTLFYVYRV